MAYFYVLTAPGYEPEYQFKNRLIDIIARIKDGMKFDYDGGEGVNFTISLRQLDSKEELCLNEPLGLTKLTKNAGYFQLKKVAKLAHRILSVENDYKCSEKVPRNIHVCKECNIFTQNKNCIECNKETLQITK